MAMDAKMSFLSQLEHRLTEVLTVADMSRLMRTISDTLQDFHVEETARKDSEPDDLLNAFVASMRVQSRSEKTIARYCYVIGRFMEFAKAPTRDINVYHVRNWLTEEKARGIQDSTLEGDRQVLSAYFGWLFRESLIVKNPVVNVGVIKVAKRQKKTYTDADIERLSRNCETLRDQAIVHFLKSTGCRISEMTGLDRNAVDLEAKECVVHGKGNKERSVYMDDVAAMLVGEYLRSRRDFDPALFVGKRGRLTPGGVRCMLKHLGERAGVDHVHPHKFRRTLATDLARHGMQIQEISALLGHDKLDTTMEYVMINREDTKYSYRRFA